MSNMTFQQRSMQSTNPELPLKKLVNKLYEFLSMQLLCNDLHLG